MRLKTNASPVLFAGLIVLLSMIGQTARPAVPGDPPSDPAEALLAAIPPPLPKDASRPLVGAIRWDAWSGGTVTKVVEQTLGPAKYHHRLPWFAEVKGDKQVAIFGGRQIIMDMEIAWAAYAGLDYWAFLLYPEDSPMSVSLARYLQSPRRKQIRFCLILHNALGAPDDQWPREQARLIKLLKEPGYQTVLDGRPLVFEFSAVERAVERKRFDGLREAVRNAGLNPYYVFMGWNPEADWRRQSGNGFDAVSHYARASGSARDYASLVRETEEYFWRRAAEARVPYIPLVTTGWNKEPRKDHPVPWEKDAAYLKQTEFIPSPAPDEIAAHLRRGLAFVRKNAEICPARALVVYAWNEHDEGGWLAPTWTPEGRPNSARLDAVRRALISGETQSDSAGPRRTTVHAAGKPR